MVLKIFINAIGKTLWKKVKCSLKLSTPFRHKYWLFHYKNLNQKLYKPFISPHNNRQPFFMRFCNGVDENFQPHFFINIGYCFTKVCITNITIL